MAETRTTKKGFEPKKVYGGIWDSSTLLIFTHDNNQCRALNVSLSDRKICFLSKASRSGWCMLSNNMINLKSSCYASETVNFRIFCSPSNLVFVSVNNKLDDKESFCEWKISIFITNYVIILMKKLENLCKQTIFFLSQLAPLAVVPIRKGVF